MTRTFYECDRCGCRVCRDELMCATVFYKYVAAVANQSTENNERDLCPNCATEVREFIQKDCR